MQPVIKPAPVPVKSAWALAGKKDAKATDNGTTPNTSVASGASTTTHVGAADADSVSIADERASKSAAEPSVTGSNADEANHARDGGAREDNAKAHRDEKAVEEV
jgi:hypothetical protein